MLMDQETIDNALLKMMAGSIRTESGCLIWTGPVNNMGYGRVSIGGREDHQTWYHHRLSFFAANLDIDPSLDVGHQCHDDDSSCLGGIECRHRRCWEPSHLVEQTRQDNLLAGNTLVASKARQTHCENGHEFTPANTRQRTRKSGGRTCRQCDADRHQAKRDREKVASGG